MIHLNGRLVPDDEARIDPADRGLLLADGLFETLLARDGRAEELEAHLARLARGADLLGLPLPDLNIALAVAETLQANGLTQGRAAVRITLTRGAGPRGLLPPDRPTPTVMVTATPSPEPDRFPARLVLADARRNEHSPLSRLKSLSYLDSVLARREAARLGADEALMLNTAESLASATAANLFLVAGGDLLTPPLEDGVLDGIVRSRVLTEAHALGLAAREESITLFDLFAAEEAFLTNSLIGLRPVGSFQECDFEAPGPVTARLQSALI